MAFVFEVQSQDIAELKALDLTRLLKKLLHLESFDQPVSWKGQLRSH